MYGKCYGNVGRLSSSIPMKPVADGTGCTLIVTIRPISVSVHKACFDHTGKQQNGI